MEQLEKNYLITPADNGVVSTPIIGRFCIPVADYLEGDVGKFIQRIESVAADLKMQCQMASSSVISSHRLARRIADEITKGDPDAAPLFFDVVSPFVEAFLDRCARIAKVGAFLPGWECFPQRLSMELGPIPTGNAYKNTYKSQQFNWMLLRQVANAEDNIRISRPNLYLRARQVLSRPRRWHGVLDEGGDGIHIAFLARYDKFLESLRLPVLPVPMMVASHSLRCDVRIRRRIRELIEVELKSLLEELGLNVPLRASSNGAYLLSELFPISRIECFALNSERYARYFDKWKPSLMVTAVGHARQDAPLYFLCEGRRRGMPSAVLQHGGRYGYDPTVPQFFGADLCLPDIFVSWGWTEAPGEYPKDLQRARIVPLPDPKLSGFAAMGWRPPPRPKTLLIPLSKFRTLSFGLGPAVHDGNALASRQLLAETISKVQSDFDRIILTTRGASKRDDPLKSILADNPKVEWRKSREHPASELMLESHVVLWDTATTGLFETLSARIPSVVLIRHENWAPQSAWAYKLLIESGIGVEGADQAVSSLRLFLRDPQQWHKARFSVDKVCHTYGRVADDVISDWKEFLRNFAVA